MKAIIMAGGFGTRLRAVTGESPKPMAPLMGKPLMAHIVERLALCGYRDICAALKYRAEDIMEYFGDGSGFGVHMQYRIEQEPLGTAGAVKNCGDFYGDEDFLVISGDAACDFDLKLLMEQHRKQQAAVTIALYPSPAPLRYGLALTGGDGRIHSFIEKPDWPHVVTDRVNTGIYIISPRVMELVPPGQSFDFAAELFPELLRRGEKLLGLELPGYWCDIGTPLAYYQCCVDAIMGRLDIAVPEEFRCGLEDVKAETEDFEGEGLSLLIPCVNRAGLMAQLSRELMELGADYSRGIRLRGGRLSLSIRPAVEQSALRLSVQSPDGEFARDMLDSARRAIEAMAGEG